MGNPLINMMQTGNGNIMQQFQRFRNQFPANANPNDILNNMIASGKVTTGQVEQARQMARSMGLIK
jgi:hypothetical protein